jgi:hypothetical protein
MDAAQATRAATGVGLITAVIGAAIALAPARAGQLMRIDDENGLRAIGVADLALVPGLLAGTPRWPWMAARAALNLAMAAYLLDRAREQNAARPRAAAAALGALTVGDSRVAWALRRNVSQSS